MIHIGFTHMEHMERKRVILIIMHISHFLYCTLFSSLMETGTNITFRKKEKEIMYLCFHIKCIFLFPETDQRGADDARRGQQGGRGDDFLNADCAQLRQRARRERVLLRQDDAHVPAQQEAGAGLRLLHVVQLCECGRQPRRRIRTFKYVGQQGVFVSPRSQSSV